VVVVTSEERVTYTLAQVRDGTGWPKGVRFAVVAPNEEAEVLRLRAALVDAIECVESWAGYASPYFQEKWDLPGDLARLRAALTPTEEPATRIVMGPTPAPIYSHLVGEEPT
jgi:hypothetical protein